MLKAAHFPIPKMGTGNPHPHLPCSLPPRAAETGARARGKPRARVRVSTPLLRRRGSSVLPICWLASEATVKGFLKASPSKQMPPPGQQGLISSLAKHGLSWGDQAQPRHPIPANSHQGPGPGLSPCPCVTETQPGVPQTHDYNTESPG